MHADLTTPGIPLSPPSMAVSGGRFSGVLGAVRPALLGRDYEATIHAIETAFSVPRRTAERIYAGQPVRGDTTLAMFFHEQSGPALMQEGLSRLPPVQREHIAKQLMKAAELAYLQARQEQLLNEAK